MGQTDRDRPQRNERPIEDHFIFLFDQLWIMVHRARKLLVIIRLCTSDDPQEWKKNRGREIVPSGGLSHVLTGRLFGGNSHAITIILPGELCVIGK